MPWSYRKVGRFGANRFVIAQSHRYQLRAVGAPALAGEINLFDVGPAFDEVRGDFGDALIDLPEERLIPRETFVSCPHRGAHSFILDSQIKFAARRARNGGSTLSLRHTGAESR
jgi:hypothetical protein